MAGRGLRRTFTISDQSKSDLKPDDDNAGRGGRSLMDIIRQEQRMAGSGSAAGSVRDADSGDINWKSFKDRVRLRRAGNAWSDPEPELPPDLRPRESPKAHYARTMSVTKPGPEDDGEGGEPAKMSLMALLEGGGFGSGDEEEEGEGEGEEEEYEEEEEGMYNSCCVCMVRHRGEPFEPCGHTFCRLCSREMCTSQGNCPLCNGFILEILNIF